MTSYIDADKQKIAEYFFARELMERARRKAVSMSMRESWQNAMYYTLLFHFYRDEFHEHVKDMSYEDMWFCNTLEVVHGY